MVVVRGLEAALIEWINAFPLTNTKISSLSELNDGEILSKILYDIDPHYFRSILQAGQEFVIDGDTNWVTRFHGLKRIYKELCAYYTENLDQQLPADAPNLTDIAKEGSVPDTMKLLKILVTAAVLSDQKVVYVERIQGLSPASQAALMTTIQAMMELDDTGEYKDEKGPDLSDELQKEEQMAKLHAEKQAAENKAREIQRKYDRLQNDYSELQHQNSLLQEQYNQTSDRDAGSQESAYRAQLDHMQAEVQRLEDIIAEKETTINRNDNTIKALNRKLDDLVPKADLAQKLKDDLDEANHTIEKLRKTQNVAEKYRRKLESMGDLERQVKQLEDEKARAAQQHKQNEELAKQVPGLRKRIENYKNSMEKAEHEHAEILRAKERMEVELEALKDKNNGVEYQRSKDLEQIQALEEKVRDLESGVIRKVAEEESGGDLDAELTYTTKTKTDMRLKIARLEAEIAHLKEGGGVNADNVLLKGLLEDVQRQKDKLENDFLAVNSEKLLLESQLDALRGGVSIEGSEVLLKLRERLVDREQELSETKKKLSDVEAKLAITEKELVTAKSDLSLVGKDQLDALDELKSRNSAELEELRGEFEELQSLNKALSSDLDQHKTLLNKALLEKDEVVKKVTALQESVMEKERIASDLRTTIAAMEGTTEGGNMELEKRVVQLQNKLEDYREKLVKSREHIKKQNLRVADLEAELSGLAHKDADARVRDKEEKVQQLAAELEKAEERHRRELEVVAGAWWDLSSRMQTNSVVLARRSEAHHSWLNRQRNAILGPMVGSGF